jgi:hypothetical protein
MIVSLLRGGERFFDDLLEGFERLSPEHRNAIDNESRRASHTELVGNSGLFLNCLRVLSGIQAFIKGCGIQVEIGRKLFEIILVKGPLILAVLAGEELIGIFPKSILICSALAGFSRPHRFFSKESYVPVTHANFPVIYILFVYLTPRVSGMSAAVRSLKIAEFDQRDGSVGIPLEMLDLGHQIIHELLPGSRINGGLRGFGLDGLNIG